MRFRLRLSKVAPGYRANSTVNDRFRWVHILVANVPTMVLTAAQRAALTQILDTASDLNRWRLRAHRVEEPQRGSELGVDDL